MRSIRPPRTPGHDPSGQPTPGPMAAYPGRSCHTGVMLTTRIILAGLVLAQLIDALTFTIGVSRFGIGLESNGLIGVLYGMGGLPAVLAVKVAAILLTLSVLVTMADDHPRLLVWGGAAATAMGLLGFATNTITIVALSQHAIV